MVTLWLDLGNTRLKYWIIDQQQMLTFDAKEHLRAPNELLLGLSSTLKQFAPHFIGVSSVLGDSINQKITATLQTLNTPFEFAKVSAQHPLLRSRYRPYELGTDRWLQMLGCVDSYALQCIIGCGTALTIDFIERGIHLGGYILPNAYMQRHALYAGTAQIAVKAGKFDSTALGTTTFDAVNGGILFGIVGVVHSVIDNYPDFDIILTGGGAATLAPHLKKPVVICEDLLLLGLQRYFAHVA